MNATLTIIRGVPGTGKSTLANKIRTPDTVILEADMYFTANSGEYEFNVDKLRWAHDWCLTSTKVLLRQGHSVIVANTFTTIRELRDYIEFAIDNGIKVDVITLNDEYGSIHAVPEESMRRMRDRFVSHEEVVDYIADYSLEKTSSG